MSDLISTEDEWKKHDRAKRSWFWPALALMVAFAVGVFTLPDDIRYLAWACAVFSAVCQGNALYHRGWLDADNAVRLRWGRELLGQGSAVAKAATERGTVRYGDAKDDGVHDTR